MRSENPDDKKFLLSNRILPEIDATSGRNCFIDLSG